MSSQPIAPRQGRGNAVSIEITFSKLHVISLKEFDVFFAEGAAAMMLFLPHDIDADLFAIRRADRKRAIALLPGERAQTDG